MIDLQALLVPKISQRCKKLRESYRLTMEQISDKAAISRIEKEICPKSGNFITETVLLDYANVFEVLPEEIIFGNSEELEETLEWIFDRLFFSILQKDLSTHSDLYKNVDRVSITSQKAVLSMAEMFAEFNLQRYNFLKSDETFMDSVNKEMDRTLSIGEKFINIERDFRTTPINDDTVIDSRDICDKMWWLCKEKMIRSFKTNAIPSIFEHFTYSTINSTMNFWIIKEFCANIVPTVIEKMKNNSIFKLGLLSKQLIQDFLKEDLPESYQQTVPIKTTRDGGINITIGSRARKNDKKLPDNELKKQAKLYEIAMKMVQNGEQPDDKLLAEFEKYDIIFKEKPKEEYIIEEDIDSVISRVISSKYNGRSKNYRPVIEDGYPIFKVSNNISDEEMDALYMRWYEDTHFQNQVIPGYFTNNSQIGHRLQELLNEDILSMVESIIHMQNNLLLFLTDEDLLTFAK